MGHAPSIATKISSQRTSLDISPSSQRTGKSLIAHILDTLHHSRRLQAKGILRQYRHLLGQVADGTVGKSDASSGDRRHVFE